jgi:hypothetical protein
LHNCTINVKEGLITDCRIEGSELMKQIAKEMVGKKHLYDEILSILTSTDIRIIIDIIRNLF